MPDRQFSHVCTACRTPALIAQPRKTSRDFLILAASPIAGIVVIASIANRNGDLLLWHLLIYAVLGFVVAYIGIAYLVRGRGRTCPSCHSENLIPVASPEGSRIMKELRLSTPS